MKLAISNIAWSREQDAAVAELLKEAGIGGIEIAPTKIWPNPLAATDAEIDEYRQFWSEREIAIVAAQALLFGKPELTIFETASTREQTIEYLAGIVRICARLGAGSLVFGSPKNRRVGTMPADEGSRIAVEFFTRLGEIAANAGTCVVMEANPPIYGADFITHAAEAIALVERVNHPGFQLHLDTGCVTLAGDSIPATFDEAFPLLRHFHVSEPNLDAPGTSGTVDHAVFAEQLRERRYMGWVSLEMREGHPFDRASFRDSVSWFEQCYGRDAAAISVRGMHGSQPEEMPVPRWER